MRFIKLTSTYENLPFYFNVNLVSAVQSYPEWTEHGKTFGAGKLSKIFFIGEQYPVLVMESADLVIKMLKNEREGS